MFYKSAKKEKQSVISSISGLFKIPDSKRRVEFLVNNLQESDLVKKFEIVRELSRESEGGINALISLIDGEHDDIRPEIFKVLHKLKMNDQQLSLVIAKFQNETLTSSKLPFIWLLGGYICEQVLNLFKNLLHTDAPEVKAGIIHILSTSQNLQAIEILKTHLMSNKDPNTRLKIVETLLLLPGEDIDYILEKALSDASRLVVAAASGAIKKRSGLG